MAVSDTVCDVLHQTDTFFHTPKGRLKLREFADDDAQLIYYHRRNEIGPKLSEYTISRTQDAEDLKTTLSETVGQLAEVKKRRQLLKVSRIRLHFDSVEGLGNFIELEVVLRPSETLDIGQREATRLMDALEIKKQDLIDCAYVDLLLQRAKKRCT